MLKPIALCAALLSLSAALNPATVDAAGAQMSGGRLSIGGTDIGESFYISEVQGRGYWIRYTYVPGPTYIRVRIVENSSGDTLVNKYFLKDDIASIIVTSHGGDDYIEANTDIGCGLYGGTGSDEIHGGYSDDYIDAGPESFAVSLDVIYGRGGNDVLFCGQKWSAPLPYMIAPLTEMHGGPGNDTFIYRNSDNLYMDNFSGPGWLVAPDYTFGSNHDRYPGMHLIME